LDFDQRLCTLSQVVFRKKNLVAFNADHIEGTLWLSLNLKA